MGSDETTRIPKTDRELLGELLKARVHDSQDSHSPSLPPPSLTCAECGAQMTESSEFCWMCGATRSSSQNPITSFTPRAHTTAPGPVLHKFVPPGPLPSEAPPTAAFVPGAYSSASTAAAPQLETAPGPQSEPEPALFAHLYARPQEQTEEVEEQPRKFDYRVAVLVVVLLAAVVLGYRQRQNASALYASLRQTITQQMGDVWKPKQTTTAERKGTSSPAENRTKQPHTRVRRSGTKVSGPAATVSESKVEVPKPSFLRVRVEGQPSPELASNTVVPGAFMGDMIGSGLQVAHRSPTPPFAVTISPRESLSLLLKQVPPSYPLAAQASRVAGPVVLKAVIHKDGNVGNLSVVIGNPLLTQAAIDAVRQWVYRPYYRNGEPTEVETLVVVDFPTAARADVGKSPTN